LLTHFRIINESRLKIIGGVNKKMSRLWRERVGGWLFERQLNREQFMVQCSHKIVSPARYLALMMEN
jgi:hypothetical protein